MAKIKEDQLTRRVLTRLGQMALDHARPEVAKASFTLARALNLFIQNETQARIQIPHYWALYVHDGRGPFGPVRKKYICWFIVPLQDPRLRAGVTPVRARNIKHLTKAQFLFWLQKNREARARGEQAPMIVTKFVKKATRPTKFFENSPDGGMHGFLAKAQPEAAKVATEEIRKLIGSRYFRFEKDSAVAVIR